VPAPMTLEQKTKMLSDMLGGTVRALADTGQLLWLDSEAPHLGAERAGTLGALWAPIIAPYLPDDQVAWLPWILAVAGTTSAAYSWSDDYKKFAERKKANKRALSVVPEPAPVEANA
jgi:hypothetical protein